MSKLLICIDENIKFDINSTIDAIASMSKTLNSRKGIFIGAIFECEYASFGYNTIVRLSPEAETITVEGLGDESLDFALELQRQLTVPLHAVDLDCTFNVALQDFGSVAEFRKAISS